MVAEWVAGAPGRARLRGRDRGAPLVGRFGAGGGADRGPADRVGGPVDRASRRDDDRAGRRAPVVRLVRLQRR